MNKNRGTRTLAVLALIVAVAGISIAFATLTQVLNIEGQAKVTGAEWKIEFVDSTLQKQLKGKAKESEGELPKLTGTKFEFDVVLYQPGDAVIYTFDMKNMGSIDAEIFSVTLMGGYPEGFENDINFDVTYADGTAINNGDPLNAGDTAKLKVTVEFKDTAESVPANDIDMLLIASIMLTQR